MKIQSEKPNEEALAKDFTQKIFLHSIATICADDAREMAKKIGYGPILILLDGIVKENAARKANKQGELSIPACFRSKIRALKIDGMRELTQEAETEKWHEHVAKVTKEKESGWQPTNEVLMGKLDELKGEAAAGVEYGKRFLTSFHASS